MLSTTTCKALTFFGDLHIHTTASDGVFTPEEAVRYARSQNITTIAITDHDSLEGISEAMDAGRKFGVKVIPGIELNADVACSEVHILGYYLDVQSGLLREHLSNLRKARVRRAKAMVEKLNALGVLITFEEVLEMARGAETIARPHLARVLAKKKQVSHPQEAFERYLGIGKPAYVERMSGLTPKEALRLIKDSGGIAVFAHPAFTCRDDILEALIPEGLDGIEVFHSRHSFADSKKYLELARKYGLLVTGGSDCHGPSGARPPLIGTVRLELPYVLALERNWLGKRGMEMLDERVLMCDSGKKNVV